MSELRKTPVTRNGQKGIIVHDKLCADGPKDPETNKPLIDPTTGEEYPGPNDDMADLMHEYLVKIRSPINLNGSSSSATVPRFGVLSLIAMNTPIYVYDHPAFKEIANTAFTDGINVFVDADFMRKLVVQEEEQDGNQSGVIFLIMHELMHKLYYHVDRLKNFPPRIANIAEDMVINGKLVKSFTMLKPVKLMSEIGFGMKPEEADKYHTMSEEVVAEMLLIKERKKQQDEEQKKKQKGQSQGGGGGGSGEGEGEGEDGEPSNEKGKGKGKGKEGKEGDGDGEEEYSPIHHISPEDLIDIIEKNGLSNSVGKALNLPKSDDIDGIGKMKQRSRLQDTDAVQTAISQASKCNGQYPGQHIAEEAADLIGGLEKGKISWKLSIKKHVMGDGQKLHHSDEEANISWYLTKETMGVEPWYSGALVPQAPDETVLCLVDTSGSTGGGTMRKEFLQEVLGLKRGLAGSDTARKVILFSADTVLRGQPIEITDANISSLAHDGVPIFGDGGTDFKSCLDEALALPIMKKEKVKTVIYFTDCYDNTPSRSDFEEFLNKGVKFLFVTVPGTWNERFNAGVSDWAEVACIEDGTQINFDKAGIDTDTRKNNM